MSRKRLFTLLLVLGLMTLSAAGSWLVGSRIQSPAEAAARTAPPTPSPILVPVEARVLTSDIVTRGTARYGLPQTIAIVPSALKPKAGVITTLPLLNTQLKEGDVLLTASGRPVFILQGKLRTYRDLGPGLSGEDVRQLERALARMGFNPGPFDGKFDEKTSTAVAAWYTAAGWEPFGPTAEQLTAIRALEQELAVAMNQKANAADSVAAASSAIQAARSNAESAVTVAMAEVGVRTRAKERINADPDASPEDRSNAAAALAAAQAAEGAARKSVEASVQAIVVTQNAALREGRLAADTITRLTAELETARSKTGIQIPADEIIFIPDVPVRVGQITAAVGDAASGPVMTLTNNQLAVDTSVALDEAPLVQPGMTVTIDEPTLGLKATGVVARVAEAPGLFGVDGFHIYVEVVVDKTDLALQGFSLRLTIPVQSTGEAVTVVPVSALSLAADGTSRVQVEQNGALSFVTVEPGLSAGGFVAVRPVITGTLSAGQPVVIGFQVQP